MARRLPLALLSLAHHSLACTSFIVTKGASADGSVQISYASDNAALFGEVARTAAADHPPDAVVRIIDADSGRHLGDIPQVAHTYSYVGLARYGGVNEHQVAIGETTFGGLPSLQEQPGASVDYGTLMQLVLQRARSAQEALNVMTSLVAAHGYASEGESFSIADAREAWLLEMIGKGAGERGAVWVARRIPDGHVSGHANQARITTFPRDDPANWRFADDVVSFAVRKGLYPADAPEADFDFAATYHPISFQGARASDARVWDFFRRVDGAMGASWTNYATGADLRVRLPLSIRAPTPVALNTTFWATRSKFEGTPLDMTHDVGAGPYASAFRALPLFWTVPMSGAAKYYNERPAATQQTGGHFVASLRDWLPNAVGGVMWVGVDDAALAPRTPIYAGARAVPAAYSSSPRDGVRADALTFSFDSAWWVSNLVANLAYWQYAWIVPEVHAAIVAHETALFERVATLEAQATALHATDPEAAHELLTTFSVQTGQQLVTTWLALFQHLFVRHRDGVIVTSTPAPSAGSADLCPLATLTHQPRCAKVGYVGYAAEWYAHLAVATGTRFLMPLPPVSHAQTLLQRQRTLEGTAPRQKLTTLAAGAAAEEEHGDVWRAALASEKARLERETLDAGAAQWTFLVGKATREAPLRNAAAYATADAEHPPGTGSFAAGVALGLAVATLAASMAVGVALRAGVLLRPALHTQPAAAAPLAANDEEEDCSYRRLQGEAA